MSVLWICGSLQEKHSIETTLLKIKDGEIAPNLILWEQIKLDNPKAVIIGKAIYEKMDFERNDIFSHLKETKIFFLFEQQADKGIIKKLVDTGFKKIGAVQNFTLSETSINDLFKKLEQDL